MGIFSKIKNEVKGWFPAYFALVMATGIVSIGTSLFGFKAVNDVLFWVNNFASALLLALLLCRLLFYYPYFLADLSSFKKGAGFFSVVAASSILGTQYAQLKHNYGIASGQFWFAFVMWLVLIYAFFLIITTECDKPSLDKGIDGVWLLLVVATESLAVLGTTLAKQLLFAPEQVLFVTLLAFLLGIVLYLVLIKLIFYRLTFFQVKLKTWRLRIGLAWGWSASPRWRGQRWCSSLQEWQR
ncbi:tellurite resistance/C4-dicarboxylate transporter family protein [Pontibacter chitinilyticus]|uniref:tellurite resistance/C4-dicarboxylate transporter family protein n=1 Tax=Pontibacter chitinilyticus TaxID=2674989 RepID=UPI0032192054